MLTASCVLHGNPIAAMPNPASLDVGVNTIEPLAEPRNDNDSYGRILESVRMAEAAIDPIEADPSLKFPLGSTVPLPTPAKATQVLAKPVRPVLERRGMLAGFVVGGSDRKQIDTHAVVGGSRMLSVVLLRFPDSAAATQAAREIDAADAGVSSDNVSVPIPNTPSAFAHWRPTVPTLAATIARDAFVISVLAGSTAPDLGVLTDLARKAFDAQTPRLRDFPATPPDRLATLPLDRDGMLAKLLPEVPGKWPFPTVVTLNFDENAGWRADITATGIVLGPRGTYLSNERQRPRPVELAAFNGWNILERFPTAIAARQEFTNDDSLSDPELRPAPSPAAVPDTRCVEQLDVPPQMPLRFSCQIMYGRYVAMIRGRDLQSTHQRVAAEFALLASSE
jgi:hypothetical protein